MHTKFNNFNVLAVFIILSSIFLSNLNNIEFIQIIFISISDAYLQVSVFVAATLFIFYGSENFFGLNLRKKINDAKLFQIPICSGLGCLPGCGGAIVVISQYSSGSISFGSVVAVLTSTMGDAAFLLLASEPKTGFFIIVLSFFVGTITGWIINFTHPKNFLRPIINFNNLQNKTLKIEKTSRFTFVWLIIFLPGMIFGIFTAFQYDLNLIFQNNYINNPISVFGFSGAILCILLHTYKTKGKIHKKTSTNLNNFLNKSISDTNFVTVWVVIAFLAFEITIYLTSFELERVFNSAFFMTPIISVIIGFLPGCGPQILVTSIYLMGLIPLSAQIGNSISNDGDALFPILALAPKVAIIATLYSGIPALLVSYGYMFIYEI